MSSVKKGQKGITRREFAKGAAGVAGVAAVGALASCVPLPAATPAAPTPAPQKWDYEADVVVAGAGVAGLPAAVTAVQAGVDVILIEASKKVGGTGLYSSAGIGLMSYLTYEDMMKKVPFTDPKLGRALYENWEDFKSWLTATGVPYEYSGNYVRMGGVPIPEGPRLYFGALQSAFETRGGKLLLKTKAVKLFANQQGAIVGIRAVGPNGALDIKAKAVILATGSIQANKEMLVKYVGPYADLTASRSVPYDDGSGLLMGVEVGALLSRSFTSFYGHSQAWPLIIPQDPEAWEAMDIGLLHDLMAAIQMYSNQCIAVNLNGERCVDESIGDDITANACAKQPEARLFIILDQQIRDKFVGKAPCVGKEYIDLLIERST